MTILVIAEHNNKKLNPATLNVINAAQQLGEDIVVLIAGFNCAAVAAEAAKIVNIKKILLADAQDYQYFLAENLSDLIAEIAKNFNYVLAPATTFGKNILPRVAALLDVTQISDVMKIVNQNTFVRPIYAGNALATVQSDEPIKVLTIRTTAFEPIDKGAACCAPTSAPVEKIAKIFENHSSQFVSQQIHTSSRPELTQARIVIAGGRGLQSAENFKKLEVIADKLGAAIGASRAAVDAGFVPNDYQVGQTGKVVVPDLYIAIGISGAIQHLAGMKDSKVIVAINKDPDAPIFQVADYGLVADLFTALSEIEILLTK